jgi:hypothetical protein
VDEAGQGISGRLTGDDRWGAEEAGDAFDPLCSLAAGEIDISSLSFDWKQHLFIAPLGALYVADASFKTHVITLPHGNKDFIKF